MSKKVRTAIIIILSAILIYSITRIVIIQIEYSKADDIYNESRTENFHMSEETPAPQDSVDYSAPEPEEYFPEAYADIEDLMAINRDIVGWLWIPDTNINYPLLKAEDNQKYLGLSYNLQWTNSGSIFMDFRNSSNLSDDNTIIYGHNMKNGGMFGSLKKYSDIEYLEEHRYVYIFTKDRILKYKIFAAYKTESSSQSYTMGFSGDISFDDYINYVIASAGNNLNEAIEEKAPLMMLSTCTSVRRTERFVINTVLIAEKENDEN